MSIAPKLDDWPMVTSFDEFVELSDYSLMDSLNGDPDGTEDGDDHRARQVFSGHFVPVAPTPLPDPEYVSHSRIFFHELGLSDELAHDARFIRLFSGDLSAATAPMRQVGWATGYASVYFRHRIYPSMSLWHRQRLWRWSGDLGL
jgi:hypothetical protein